MRLARVSGLWAWVVCAAAWAQDRVELRERGGVVEGKVVEVGPAGVTVEGEGGGRRVVSWDRVRAVEGHGEGVERARGMVAGGEGVWRARSRVERQDYAGAEPILEAAFAGCGADWGPTGAVVSEGLVRCRLARGAQGAAVWPWLMWLSIVGAKEAGVTWEGGGIALSPVIDGEARVSWGLAPVWVSGAAASALATSPGWDRHMAGGGEGAALAAIYRAAARYEAGLDCELPERRPEWGGAGLAWDVVRARVGNAEERAASREALRARMSAREGGAVPRWVEAWCRVGVGRSLVREEDAVQRMLGVGELMHLPARFASDHEYLAGVALAEAAVALSEMGESAAAAAVRSELVRRFPSHPAARWERLVGIESGGGGGWRAGSGAGLRMGSLRGAGEGVGAATKPVKGRA